jgi:putative membrane protein insertion efficiency factor
MSRHAQITAIPASMPARALLACIAWYQRWLSPVMGNQCRFFPSCSHYTQDAILRHGALRGSLLGAARICRCNPLCEGGTDPVPDTFSFRRQSI